MQTPSAEAAKEVGKTVTDVGRIFGASADGLILYALILGTFMIFFALCLVLWLHSRERARSEEKTAAMIASFTSAASITAEAVKDLATAVTSSASADMTFKQAMAGQMIDCEGRMRTIEERNRKRDELNP